MKPEVPARIFAFFEIIQFGLFHKSAIVLHAGELQQIQTLKKPPDLTGRMNPVSVEACTRLSYRKGKEKVPARRQYSRKLGKCQSSAGRIERVAVAAEADMFGDMKA
jgi:hypothetical protein